MSATHQIKSIPQRGGSSIRWGTNRDIIDRERFFYIIYCYIISSGRAESRSARRWWEQNILFLYLYYIF